MTGGLFTAGNLASADIPDRVRNLADKLSRVHGRILAARESSGIQLYMGCPRCLEREGDKALRGMKFSVNASRYFVIDQWARRAGTYNVERSASCMKCAFSPNVEELLRMEPLEDRGFRKTDKDVVVGSMSRRLVPDGRGNMVPPGPGKVCPLSDLPSDHPGRWYVESRGYDVHRLEDHLQACWCYEELPQSQELSIYYKHLPMGFKSTPQGRIIFFASVNGALVNWQGRIPEYIEGNRRHYWHPYQERWVLCEIKEDGVWNPVPEIASSRLDWDMPKYRTAKHGSRHETLFGFDAAVEWSLRTGVRTCLLSEGPLDIARFGPPALAMVGSFLSPAQAALILNNFRKVVHLPDKGAAGDKSRTSVEVNLAHRCELYVEELPEGRDDPGELSPGEVEAILGKHDLLR